MCFGSGPSAEKMYQKQRQSYGALPSLLLSGASSGKKATARPVFRDVVDRVGKRQRSLLAPRGEY